MPELSSDLLAVARLLATVEEGTPSSGAMLRRAVSTAYYALFHKVSHAAAQRFMGPDQEASAGFALIYRCFDHRNMKMVCQALRAATLKVSFQIHLRRTAVSRDMLDFAKAFPELQEARHLADYDPRSLSFPGSLCSDRFRHRRDRCTRPHGSNGTDRCPRADDGQGQGLTNLPSAPAAPCSPAGTPSPSPPPASRRRTAHTHPGRTTARH